MDAPTNIHFYLLMLWKKCIYIFIKMYIHFFCNHKNVYTFLLTQNCCFFLFRKNSNKNVYTFLWLQQKCIYIFFCNHKNVYTFLLQRIKMYVALHTFLSKEQNLSPPFDKNVYWATYIFIEQIKMYIAQYTFLLRCFAL